MDVRLKDSVRKSEQVISALVLTVNALREDTVYMKKILREIKSAVVRKYGVGK